MQKDLIDFLLVDMRPRPGMYLTEYNLNYLDIYLTGVQITCWELDKSGDYSDRFFGEKGFLQWSWDKYKLGQPAYRLKHYSDIAKGDEKLALDHFFEDLETFHTNKNN